MAAMCQLGWAAFPSLCDSGEGGPCGRSLRGLEGRREAAAVLWLMHITADLLTHPVGRKQQLAPLSVSLPPEPAVYLFSSVVKDPGFCKIPTPSMTEAMTDMSFRDAVCPRGVPVRLMGFRLFLLSLTYHPSSIPTCLTCGIQAPT